MNIVAWMALFLLVAYTLNGLRIGLVRALFSTFSCIIAIVIALNVSAPAGKALAESGIAKHISNKIERTLMYEREETADKDRQSEIIEELPIPKFMKNTLNQNNRDGVYRALGIQEFKEYVAKSITQMVMKALTFILLFIGIMLILRILCTCLDIISHLPVLHSLNKVGGMLFGALNGLMILWIICIAISIFSGSEIGGFFYEQINNSMFLKIIYNFNFLQFIAADLKQLVI